MIVLPNESHAEPLQFEWEYVEWANAEEMVLKLLFQNPMLVSSETPEDFI